MIDTEKTRKLVVDYIRKHPGTSFIELERLFDANGVDWRGPYALCWPGHPSIVMWNGWNREAICFVSDMFSDNVLDLRYDRDVIMSYVIDGGVLSLPVARNIRDYASDRWMPTLLELGDKA